MKIGAEIMKIKMELSAEESAHLVEQSEKLGENVNKYLEHILRRSIAGLYRGAPCLHE